MQRITLLAVLGILFLFGRSTAQDPSGKREPKPELSKTASLANKKTRAQMQGAWRLVDMQLVDKDSNGLEDAKIDHAGFCLVSGGYLSIEFHLRVVGRDAADQGRSFVTGLHRFELDEEGGMETATVIATKTDSRGNPVFEAPDTARHYAIELEGNSMTLTRDDGHTLVFERLQDDRSHVDFFGNPVSDDEDADEEGAKKKDEKKDERDEDG